MVLIQNSTTIVAATGIASFHVEVQGGPAVATNKLTGIIGPSITSKLTAASGVSLSGKVTQFEGVTQSGIVSVSSPFLVSSSAITVFSGTSSQDAFILASVGTSGSVEKFFDTSPFFFTPSEIDPNTLRDIREAEEFMIFGKTTVASFDNFRNTVGSTDTVAQDARGTTSRTAILNAYPVVITGAIFTVSGSDTVNQVDQTAPFFAETNPASGTSQVPASTTLEFHVKDSASALDQGTIEVSVDGVNIVSAGSTVTGPVWPVAQKTVIAPGDIEYIFTRVTSFVQGSTVVVSGSFADLADPVSNLGEETYDFTLVGSGGLQVTITGSADADPPVITPTDPASSATQISPDTQVLWKITDVATGVDPSTVKLLLNGAIKLQDDVAVEGSFSRVANAENGFDYTYTPVDPFAFGSTVTGSIMADDNAGNSSSLSYEFTVTPADTLSIQNFFLAADESTLLTAGTLMSVEVVDFTYGIASGTTTFTLNGEVPGDLVATYTGTGPNSVVFSILVDPLVNFREDLVVVVHAENQFPGNFPVIQEQQFTLRPGYDVNWPNRRESAAGGPEEIFPYFTDVEVLSEVKNFAKNFGEASSFFNLFTESQPRRDLGATIISNVKVADIPAILTSVNPFFEYGKIITLEIEADDLAGNQFRLTHIFTIETDT